MKLNRRDLAKSRRRHAISGIVAAVFLFAMLFTVGTGFFIFVNDGNHVYDVASAGRAASAQTQLSEDVLLTTSAPNNVISFSANNLGGIPVNITSVYVMNSTGYILSYLNSASSGITPRLPIAVNIGAVTSVVNTGVTYVSSKTYIIKLVTQRGSTFSATYPPTATSLAAQALSSGAIGDLYLNFGSYVYYNVTSSGCPSASDSSGYCLKTLPGRSAFTIQTAITNKPIAISVQVTDLNPNQANIILNEYSFLSQLDIHGQNIGYVDWYLVSNSSTVILNHFTPVVLKYNVPTMLLFGAANAVCENGESSGNHGCLLVTDSGNGVSQPNKGGSSQLSAGTEVAVFIVSHGCKGLGVTTCIAGSANYGQNSPYVTTLYY